MHADRDGRKTDVHEFTRMDTNQSAFICVYLRLPSLRFGKTNPNENEQNEPIMPFRPIDRRLSRGQGLRASARRSTCEVAYQSGGTNPFVKLGGECGDV